jgi:hypothetical protein
VPRPGWVDMTNYVEGLEKLNLSWDASNTAQKGSTTANKTGSNFDKGISLDVVFYGLAYEYINEWLLSNKCQILNSIDVLIQDNVCKKSHRLFEIKIDGLAYKVYDKCRITVTLREQDPVWHVVHKTFIWDNHQNWFNQNGTATKEHPTFLTCIEPRPRLMNSVRMALVLFFHSNPAVNLIDFISQGSIKDDTRRILELDNFCPAPLIREYIDNVAAKCGLSVDTIFHRPGTAEYNACIYHPLSGQFYTNDEDSELSPSAKFLFENRWSVTLAELLDKLRGVYCAEWYVTPGNTIVFKPVAELESAAILYDFTAPGAIEIRSLGYSFSGDKKSAYGRYEYGPDGSDLGSQEIANLYNDIVDYDGPANNPMLEGEKSKLFEFAPTAFVRDGRVPDYIRLIINDAETGAYIVLTVLAVIIAVLLAGIVTAGAGVALTAALAVWAITIAGKANNLRDYFCSSGSNYNGAIRLVSANQTLAPRIIVWDGVNLRRAKAVATTSPAPNSYYNPAATPYATNNPISNDNPGLRVYNYPVYFDSKYLNNQFDRFHDGQDNPLKSNEANQSFYFEMDLCCDTVDLLGLWQGGDVKIGRLLKLEQVNGVETLGRIGNIQLDYEKYLITVKGKVLKR